MSDLAEKTYGGGTPTTSNEAYWNGDIPWIQSSDVVDGKLLGVEPRKWITQDGLNNSAAQLIPGNSIAIITRVGVGKLAFMPYSYATSQDFLSLSKLNAEPLFTVYACYKKLQSELNAVQGTSIKGITKDELLAKNIMVPRYAEQQQIGTFFKQLDNLITLHQRQPFLHSTPEISLTVQLIHPFYTSSWEQRKVSDLAEKTYGGGTPTTSNEAYWNGDIPWIQSSDVVDGKLLGVEPRKWITQDGLNNSAAQLIPGNSIAIITRVGVGKLAFMPYSYATSQDFLSLSKLNAEPLFTVYACYKKLQSELNAVQGTSIKGITKDELLAKNIMVPRYAEQQQIGTFFKQLDNLITLHQRKGKAAVTGCSNDANNSKGVYCKARDFGYKCYKKPNLNRFDA